MKGYLVNIENNEFENYLIYLDDIPSYDKNKNQWFGFGEPIVVDKNNISRNVKLPAKGEITEVNILIVGNEPSKFYQGCKVKYNVFDWSSFLFGGLIYGGCVKAYITEVQGIDWLNGKILVQKHNNKKPKWYDWDNFEIV